MRLNAFWAAPRGCGSLSEAMERRVLGPGGSRLAARARQRSRPVDQWGRLGLQRPWGLGTSRVNPRGAAQGDFCFGLFVAICSPMFAGARRFWPGPGHHWLFASSGDANNAKSFLAPLAARDPKALLKKGFALKGDSP